MRDGAARPDVWTRLQPWALPGFLAVVVGLFLLTTPDGAVISAEADGSHGMWTGTVGLWNGESTALPMAVAWALDALVVVGVCLSRRSPLWGLVLTVLPFATAAATGALVWGWWLGVLAVAVVGAFDGWRRAVLPTLTAIGLAAVYVWTGIPAMLPTGPVWAVSSDIPRYADHDVPVDPAIGDHVLVTALYAFWTVAAVTVAAAVGAVGRSRDASREAAAAGRRAADSQAVTAERARVAHDLHDVVAHHVSLVAVRAESAPYVHPGLDDAARGVLTDIAGDARAALGELRQVLAVLQRSEDAAPDLAPQPAASDVVGLVDAARAAGQDVTFVGAPDLLARVPATVGYAVYRAAQEALTNARRHAPASPARVDLDVVGAGADETGVDGSVVLRVANPLANGTGPGEPGRGLTGMRERVEALGGTLCSGTAGDGVTFVVEARLPFSVLRGGAGSGRAGRVTGRAVPVHAATHHVADGDA
ncbi:histidine kinase [Cellulosimicrobium sp. Marseille-Q4280]|uniref:histidine kinase n=1 Tax=Cellulosimicrobium sp. Marseille-Q4280 TaxID=2937992 RepID=UPI00203BC763|nr:histidine kinase [Cellulosimicrobium sp. Marseille-Q4280]